jgi:hypothetical protein
MVTTFWGEIVSSRLREQDGSTVLCESESVSLRHSPAMKQGWSPDLQVHGELIWSRVSPHRTSGLGFIQTHYS